MTAKTKNGPKDGRTYLDNARDAWKPLPKWVETLAREADAAHSQADIARKCGFKNPSVVSSIVRKTWPGRFDLLEAQVRGAFMHAEVDCPATGGAMAHNICVANQTSKPSAANPARAKFPFACRKCPNAIKGAKHAAE